MKPILNLWMQPIYARMNLDSKKSLYWILGVVFVLGQLLATLIFLGNRQKFGAETFLYAFLISFGLILVIVFMAWFAMLVQYLGQQYSPARAALLPQIKRHMQFALAIPIVLVACSVTLIASLVEKQFFIWPGFLCVTIMLFIAISMRSPWMVVPMILSFQLPVISERIGLPKWNEASLIAGVPIWVFLLIAMIAMLVVGLHWMFSIRGDALFEMHKRTRMFQDAMNGKKTNENKMTLGFSMLFFRWMERSIRAHQKHVVGSKSELLVYCLSPRLHWTTIFIQMSAILIAGISAVALLKILLLRDAHDFILGFSAGFSGLMALVLPMTIALMLFSTVYQSRAEQSILSLAPNLGNSVQQNKTYMRYLTKQFFILYGISMVTACVIAKFGSLSELKLAMLGLFLTCLFPLSLGLTVSFGRMKSVNDHPLLKLFLLCVLLFAIGAALILLISPTVAWVYCGIVLMVTFTLLWKRLHANLQKNMFPVGRAV